LLVVAVAWIYVVVLMAVVEAASAQGTLLGALFTLLLYGALPLSIVLYLLATPARRRALRAAEQAAAEARIAPASESAPDPDGCGHAPGHAVAPVREEP
jgi:hypothetical protein